MTAERRIVGLPNSGAWAYLARCLLSRREIPGLELPKFSGPLVLIRAELKDLEDAADAFEALAPLFPEAPQPAARFGEDPQERLASLARLDAGARLALALPESLALPAYSPEESAAKTVVLRRGARAPRAEVLAGLEAAGYRRVDFVESPGEYAVRGAVLDFFSLEPLRAVRALYDEDTVESLRVFDPATQGAGDFVSEARAGAAAEAGATRPLSERLGLGALWIAEDGLELQAPEGAVLWRAGRLLDRGEGESDFGARPHAPTGGMPLRAFSEMGRQAGEGRKVLLYSLNHGEDSRLQELVAESAPEAPCQFLIGPLRQGFVHEPHGLAVFSASEIFERRYRPAPRLRAGEGLPRARARWRELKQGDYVVHQDYGLARYRGLTPVESPGHGVVDCLRLEFRGSDALYIPMTEFSRVQKYSGADGKRPRLSSLDTRSWEELKGSVREEVRELAAELLRLSAERKAAPGHAFGALSPMEAEFAAEFPYEETPDQARAISEVLADMAAPHPMDRLVVGDVGFGKTEVAMRAVFKCVAGAKQAAVLVPTTILAEQHFRTFSARFADYPVRLGMLSRFAGKDAERATLAGLASGTVDVVIGTSRLLQKDVRFKDLGLAVIDEEHRFGVKDKERFRALRRAVDCLALSATPIPRSLHQAFSGLRAISMIASAPAGRQAIVTRVLPWDEDRAASAVAEELARGGQAYYVHNRVSSLSECRQRLSRLLPQARLAVVHGQMKGPEIEAVMWDFYHRRYDVLIASTIIESGLDIPTVNALVVEDAHEFGLAQLYQLRGRIGRERERAVCTLFYPEEGFELLTEEARRRLEALREFGSLGSGLRLAMRDLEIRGAGELLGARQHGFVNAVGLELYSQMLEEEAARLRGEEAAPEAPEVSLDLPVSAFIPEDYLPGEIERLEFYKKILRARPEEVPALRAELEGLCGPAPRPVAGLFELLELRALARRTGVLRASARPGGIDVFFRPGAGPSPAAVSRWIKEYGPRLRFARDKESDGLRVDLAGEPALSWLRGFLGGLLGAAAKI